MKEKQSAIPKATAKRLSLYYRIFKRFNAEKIERANSKQIAEAIGIDSATVRRDFSYFGELGRRGFGYDVKKLMNFFADLFFIAIESRANFQSVISKSLISGKRGTKIARPDKDSLLQRIPTEKMFNSCNEFFNRIALCRFADNTGNG